MKNRAEQIKHRQAAVLCELLEKLVPQVFEGGHPADRLLARFYKQRRELGSRDRRFLSEAFFSFFRWYGWSRRLGLSLPAAAAFGRLLDQADLHPALRPFVRPDWTPLGGKTLNEKCAAVNHQLRTLKQTAATPPSRFQPLEKTDLIFPTIGKSIDLPDGKEDEFYETLQQRPPTWLRLRSEAFKKQLEEAGIRYRPHPQVPHAVSVEGGASLGALGHGGQMEVQDIASQAVTLAAAPTPGSDWWDACAGAGGKALHLADLIGPDGTVLATDIRGCALHECKKRARTDGIPTIRTQRHDLAGDPPFNRQFDGVLVDAPCSGRGTWSRNPDARWRCDPRDPAQKRNLQLKLLDRAVQCVKPGGRLVYAVCTFTREETAEVLETFLAEHPGFTLDPFANPLNGTPTDGSLQIWPWDGPGDGMFIARFCRQTPL